MKIKSVSYVSLSDVCEKYNLPLDEIAEYYSVSSIIELCGKSISPISPQMLIWCLDDNNISIPENIETELNGLLIDIIN
jgi:hypothetical protein